VGNFEIFTMSEAETIDEMFQGLQL